MRKPAPLLLTMVSSVVLFACSSTQRMSLSVQEPAPVSIPSYVKSVGILNRSVAASQSKVLDVADKLFSLEGANLDKEGAKSSMEGLSTELQRDPRFTEIKVLPGNLTTVNPAVFPTPLSWNEIDKLCSENNTDVIFSLELFDTDSKLGYSANPVKINTPLGSIPGIEHEASMNTMVKTGWRIYDPKSRILLDEFAVGRNIIYRGKGINPVVAANAIIGRKEAVMEVGNKSGEAYGQRIIPYWIRVSRDYYVRANDNFIIAKRKAQTGNWNDAASLWQQEANNPQHKIAGRACYNMAIINEINGNLDKAIEWAQKSYEDYNNHLALNYVKILKYRKFQTKVVDAQESQMVSGR